MRRPARTSAAALPASSGLAATSSNCAGTGIPATSPISPAPRAEALTLSPAPMVNPALRHQYGTTSDGHTWVLVSSITSYRTKYVRTLNRM